MVLIGGQKQRDPAIKQFKKALAIEPGIGLTKSVATPEMQSAFEEARKGGAAAADTQSGPSRHRPTPTRRPRATRRPAAATITRPPLRRRPPRPPPPSPPPPAAEPETAAEPAVPSTGLDHEPVTRARPNAAIAITVNVDRG